MISHIALIIAILGTTLAPLFLTAVEREYRKALRRKVADRLDGAVRRAERHLLRLRAIESLIPQHAHSVGPGETKVLSDANLLLQEVSEALEESKLLLHRNTWQSIVAADDLLTRLSESTLPAGAFSPPVGRSATHRLQFWEHRLESRFEEIGKRIGITTQKLRGAGVYCRSSSTTSILHSAGPFRPLLQLRARQA